MTAPTVSIVVVDDVSTDGTDSIVSAAAEQLPSLQCHRWLENLTRLENWKRGIERASGDWLKIIFGWNLGTVDCLVTMPSSAW